MILLTHSGYIHTECVVFLSLLTLAKGFVRILTDRTECRYRYFRLLTRFPRAFLLVRGISPRAFRLAVIVNPIGFPLRNRFKAFCTRLRVIAPPLGIRQPEAVGAVDFRISMLDIL